MPRGRAKADSRSISSVAAPASTAPRCKAALRSCSGWSCSRRRPALRARRSRARIPLPCPGSDRTSRRPRSANRGSAPRPCARPEIPPSTVPGSRRRRRHRRRGSPGRTRSARGPAPRARRYSASNLRCAVGRPRRRSERSIKSSWIKRKVCISSIELDASKIRLAVLAAVSTVGRRHQEGAQALAALEGEIPDHVKSRQRRGRDRTGTRLQPVEKSRQGRMELVLKRSKRGLETHRVTLAASQSLRKAAISGRCQDGGVGPASTARESRPERRHRIARGWHKERSDAVRAPGPESKIFSPWKGETLHGDGAIFRPSGAERVWSRQPLRGKRRSAYRHAPPRA